MRLKLSTLLLKERAATGPPIRRDLPPGEAPRKTAMVSPLLATPAEWLRFRPCPSQTRRPLGTNGYSVPPVGGGASLQTAADPPVHSTSAGKEMRACPPFYVYMPYVVISGHTPTSPLREADGACPHVCLFSNFPQEGDEGPPHFLLLPNSWGRGSNFPQEGEPS